MLFRSLFRCLSGGQAWAYLQVDAAGGVHQPGEPGKGFGVAAEAYRVEQHIRLLQLGGKGFLGNAALGIVLHGVRQHDDAAQLDRKSVV